MQIKPSIFKGVVLSLLACALFASPAYAVQPKTIEALNRAAKHSAMSDAEFIRLCRSGSLERIKDAIESGANVNARDKDGVTPLMNAAIWKLGIEEKIGRIMTFIITGMYIDTKDNSNIEIISALIKARADVNAKDRQGWTPLMYALSYTTNSETIAALVKAGADIDDDFIELCAMGSLQQIKNAIKNGANINAKNNIRRTPLIWAARNNPNPEVIMFLIKAGADINTEDNHNFRPLTAALLNENINIKIIEAMIKAGANVKANHGLSPLSAAAQSKLGKEVITVLVNAGAYVNTRSNRKQTPLMDALMKMPPNLEVVTTLIKAGADVNAVDIDGKTPLMYAKEFGDEQFITALIEAGADVNVMNNAYFIALCKKGSLQQIKDAIKNGANVNAKDDRNQIPLMWAARYNRDPEVVKALIEAGARVNERDNDGMTSLIYAITAAERRRYQGDIISALIKGGADVNAKGGRNGWTPLIWAVKSYDSDKTITALIEAGADVNAEDYNGRNLLFWLSSDTVNKEKILAVLNKAGLNTMNGAAFIEICKQGSLQQVKDAIKKGVNVNTKDSNGYTALMAAAGFNSDAKVTIALIKAGADVNAKDIQGFTPLDSALQNTKEITAKVLIMSGADVNVKGKNGRTPIMNAAGYYNSTIITALIKARANVNAKDDRNQTPLMWAARYNRDPEVVKALIEAGADVNARNIDGRAPLMWAAYNPNPKIIMYLIEAGADPKAMDNNGKKAINYAHGNIRLRNTDVLRKLSDVSY